MGLFGATPPPIPAFMVSGEVGAVLREEIGQAPPGARIELAVRSVPAGAAQMPPRRPRRRGQAEQRTDRQPEETPEGGPPARLFAGSEEAPPVWPQVARMAQDVAQAWSLVETVHRAAPSESLAAALTGLARRMGLPDKRVWLTRCLQRYHRGDTASDEPAEPPLAFVECDRDGEQLPQLRRQLAEGTGLGAPPECVAGEFEVRFRDESSVGSAVVREWMDLLAQKAFLPSASRLLTSYDGGASFLPDPAAPFLNAAWQGDFELLGRLLGLALWHQVTLDLPVHPHVCEMLLHQGEAEPADRGRDCARLAQIDEDAPRRPSMLAARQRRLLPGLRHA
ncbi:unnamed protein product, partial [Prorocentrum cordatum]